MNWFSPTHSSPLPSGKQNKRKEKRTSVFAESFTCSSFSPNLLSPFRFFPFPPQETFCSLPLIVEQDPSPLTAISPAVLKSTCHRLFAPLAYILHTHTTVIPRCCLLTQTTATTDNTLRPSPAQSAAIALVVAAQSRNHAASRRTYTNQDNRYSWLPSPILLRLSVTVTLRLLQEELLAELSWMEKPSRRTVMSWTHRHRTRLLLRRPLRPSPRHLQPPRRPSPLLLLRMEKPQRNHWIHLR